MTIFVARLCALAWPAVASTLSHEGDNELLETQMSAVVSASGVAAPSRRMMRAEREETATPFADIMEVFNTSDLSEQHCRWYDWSAWSYCSRSCGEGWKSRKRTVAVQPRNGGSECEGPAEDVDRCNDFDCPVDCEWGVWNDWSGCTASCGGGTRQRGKPVKVQNSSLGKPCNAAEGVQIEDCGTSACSRDCMWSDWAAWGRCSSTCGGGVKQRVRSIAEAALAGGRKCEGAPKDEEVCSLKACPEDCVLSHWSAWSACSSSCGNATSVRQRRVISREAAGGKPCSGSLEEENPCSLPECPVDCQWADWSAWTSCSITCGSSAVQWATSTRNRSGASHGGKPCVGEDQRRQMCGQSPCPVECVWDDWGEWKACTKSCGGGVTERLRNISTAPAHGGQDCLGSTRDVKKCGKTPCPQDCRFGDWEDWSECSKPCGAGTALRYRLVSAPAAHGGRLCLGNKHETGGCNGTDCVTTEELIRKGLATQITGAMHIVTADPVSYAANAVIEQVSREALAEFAELPVKRIHISMMPDISKSQDVIDWFSMLVPNSTNLSAVLHHISTKDLFAAGKILRSNLRRVGVDVLVNISKLNVRVNPWHVPKTVTSTPHTPNTSNASESAESAFDRARNNPNATRLTGVVKMVVPQPLKFAEDLKTKEATEKLLAELSGVPPLGVRASLIPDQVYHYESGESADSIPSDSVRNATGEVHAWFSLVGEVKPLRETALAEARQIAEAMMAEDLEDASVREAFFLDGAGVFNSDVKVIEILAKADGDQYQVQEETILEEPKTPRVTGVIEMITDYPNLFSADRRSEEGLQQAISQLAGVASDSVRVSLVPSEESRVDALLQLHSEEEPKPLDENAAFGNEVSAWFVITVPLTLSAEEVAQKLEQQDLSLASLKVQNCIVDEGLDLTVKVGRITVSVETTTTTTAASVTGEIRPVEFGAAAPGEQNQSSVGAVSSSAASGQARQQAANVATAVSSDVEPPTMSNPGGGDEESDDEKQASSLLEKSSASGAFAGLLWLGLWGW